MTRTLALRLYGKNDLRLEEFELPAIGDEEILADVTTNSICMSSHKAATRGPDHKRVPNDVAENPIIIGHEFSGTILEVGRRWREKFSPGTKYGIQPALSVPGHELEAPGYSFRHLGGNATKVVIHRDVLERDCLLAYEGAGFFPASLSEPVSCILGALHTSYHFTQGRYVHRMGIISGGRMAILGGAGPMGLGAIDLSIHGPRRPKQLVITDIDQDRLDRAAAIFPPAEAHRCGVELTYVNTASPDPLARLQSLVGGAGYDDVFVFAPVASLLAQASALLAFNGCLNFFAGPAEEDFHAGVNFHGIHYLGHHVVGSSGGNTDDMREALSLMAAGAIDPAVMITHVGGLDSVAETIKTLPEVPGGKRLVYTGVSMPMTALCDLAALGGAMPELKELEGIVSANNGLWSLEAENSLLANAPKIGA